MKWIRYRFHANLEDYRAIIWPPAGPYWCSGEGDSYSIVVAYLPPHKELIEYWPEANNIDLEEVNEIVFTDRFACPDWWNEELECFTP